MGEIVKTKFLVVGSGANGISPAVKLHQRGEDDFRIISRHSDFGGVWHANRYPGCITDVPALVYQLSYEMKYDWKSTHAEQEEMAEYLRDVARKYGLYEKTDFNTELLMSEWLEDEGCWKVTTNGKTYHAKFMIVATGYLDKLKYAALEGKETFKGRLFHAGEWPEGYTGAGDKVAVLGTSSSGVQIVPAMQKVAEKVIVFQRSPVHLAPLNRKFFSPEEIEHRCNSIDELEKEREEFVAFVEAAALGQGSSEAMADREARVNAHRESQVPDPVLREKLTPKYMMGCKRTTQTDMYYPSLGQPNVELVAEGAVALREHSIVSASGQEFDVDTVVMATGFEGGGDILSRIRRRDGELVSDHQKGHRKAYKSVSIANCPNLFLVTGVNGAVWHGYVPGEVVPNYVFHVVDYMEKNGIAALEVKEDAELAWKSWADDKLSKSPTVIGGCSNYCLDESGHEMQTWPGDTQSFMEAMDEFTPGDYEAVPTAGDADTKGVAADASAL